MNTLQPCLGIDHFFRCVVCLLTVLFSSNCCLADGAEDKTKTSSPEAPGQETAPSPESLQPPRQLYSTSNGEDSLSALPIPTARHTLSAVVRKPRLFTAGQRNAEIVIQFESKSRYAVTVNGTEHQVFGSELHLHTSISQRSGAEVRISARHLGLAPEVQLGANALTFLEQAGERKSNIANVSTMRLQAGDSKDSHPTPELCILLHAGDRVRISARTSQTNIGAAPK